MTLTLLVAMPAALLDACGGSDDTTQDGGNDATVDTGGDSTPNKDSGGTDTGNGNETGANDAGSDSGPVDSGTTDSGAKDASSPDTGTSLGCQHPSDCKSGFCCGTIVFNGGSIPNCDLEDASSSCKATCNSYVALSCNAVDTVRGCAAKNDCLDAGANYNQCCTIPFADASATFCWNSTFAGVAGGSCL